jgi:hypothetical protein
MLDPVASPHHLQDKPPLSISWQPGGDSTPKAKLSFDIPGSLGIPVHAQTTNSNPFAAPSEENGGADFLKKIQEDLKEG